MIEYYDTSNGNWLPLYWPKENYTAYLQVLDDGSIITNASVIRSAVGQVFEIDDTLSAKDLNRLMADVQQTIQRDLSAWVGSTIERFEPLHPVEILDSWDKVFSLVPEVFLQHLAMYADQMDDKNFVYEWFDAHARSISVDVAADVWEDLLKWDDLEHSSAPREKGFK